MTLDPTNLTKDQRSFLLYAESRCVDQGGLLRTEQMNAEDYAAMKAFVAAGYMFAGRIPSHLMGFVDRDEKLPTKPPGVTDWCELTPKGWTLAHKLRRERATRRGPFAERCFADGYVYDKMKDQRRVHRCPVST